MPYTEENGEYAVKSAESALRVVHQVETSGMAGFHKLVFDYSGDSAYTDGRTHTVVIGVPFVYRIHQPWIHNDSDMLGAVEWIRKHEVCHIQYTGGRSYSWAVDAGILEIYKYIADKSGESAIFRNNRDRVIFENKLVAKYGQTFDNAIASISASIANSLEDGRIERIQAAKQPGFGKMRVFYRGTCFWESSAESSEPADWDAIQANPAEHLTILMNAVLLLATTQLLPKNFIKRYGKTPILKEMKPLLPLITEGYLAANTHDMGVASAAICRELAPLIYDAAVATASKNEAAENSLAELLKALLTAIADSPSFSSDSDAEAEEDDTNSIASMMPTSDLMITLPDDTYDKLMEKLKKSGKSSNDSGIKICREHPKKEDPADDSDDQNSSSAKGSSSDDKKNSENSNSGGAGGSDGTDGTAENSGSDGTDDTAGNSGSDETNGTAENSDSDGTAGNSKSGNGLNGSEGNSESNGGSESNSGSESNNGSESNSGSESNNGENNLNGATPSTNGTPQHGPAMQKTDDGTTDADLSQQGNDYDEVEALMKEAAETVRASLNETLDNINKTNITAGTARAKAQVIPDNERAITQAEVREICSNFVEHKRSYKVDTPLPPELAAKGSAMHRRLETYFKSMKQPVARFRRSGVLDKSRIVKLASNHTDIFAKKGKSKNADGAVYILIDNSGSMIGDKRTAACSAAAIIEEGFKGLMPIKIVAFDSYRSIVHEVVKGWNEQQPMNCCWNFCVHGRDGAGNDDQYDIAIASYELQRRPESKKILIVLSDGAPSSISDTSKAIDDARKHGIQVSGIYFEEGEIDPEGYASEFIQMYKKDYVCCGTDQIAENLCRIMEKFAHSK